MATRALTGIVKGPDRAPSAATLRVELSQPCTEAGGAIVPIVEIFEIPASGDLSQATPAQPSLSINGDLQPTTSTYKATLTTKNAQGNITGTAVYTLIVPAGAGPVNFDTCVSSIPGAVPSNTVSAANISSLAAGALVLGGAPSQQLAIGAAGRYLRSDGTRASWQPITNADVYPVNNPYNDVGIFNVLDYGAKLDGVTDDTAAWQALFLAMSQTGKSGLIMMPGAAKTLVTATLTNAALCATTGFSITGARTERGCNALAMRDAYSLARFVWRPADTTKYLFDGLHDNLSPASTVGPFEFRNLTFDFGNANGMRFGLDDGQPLVDGAGQAYVFGVRFQNCALAATPANRTSTAGGVITRTGRKLVRLIKNFETVFEDVSLFGADVQVSCYGSDKPVFSRCRSQGAHLPFELFGSGGFGVQQSFDDLQVEGWTFAPIIVHDTCTAVGSNLRFEQNDGNPFGSGRFALPGTFNVTAHSGAIVASQSMDNILFAGNSIIELTDGTNITQAFVRTVAGVNITVDTDGLDITWSNAAATATRVHGVGPLHDSVNGDTSWENVDADASTGCPSFVMVAHRGAMQISNAQGQIGAHTPVHSVVIGNKLNVAGQYLNTQMLFNNVTPAIAPLYPEHPLVHCVNMRPNYGQSNVGDSGQRAKLGALFEAAATVRKVWAFTPKDSATASNNSSQIPFIQLLGDANTSQREWAWMWPTGSAVGVFNFYDDSLPSTATSLIRVRVRARLITGAGPTAMGVSSVNGAAGSGLFTVQLTNVMKTFEFVGAVPAEWVSGARITGQTGLQIGLKGVYVVGVTVEELALGEIGYVNGDEHIAGSADPTLWFHPTAGATQVGKVHQFTDVLYFGTLAGVNHATLNLNNGGWFPAVPGGGTQAASAQYAGTGVPNNANGANGDFYFRSDGGAGTTIYQKRAGAWVGVV